MFNNCMGVDWMKRKIAFVVLVYEDFEDNMKKVREELEWFVEEIKNFRYWKHLRTVVVEQ